MQPIIWVKSSKSGSNGQCVETAFLGAKVAVRDSKDPDGAMLTFSNVTWTAFVSEAKQGRFNLRSAGSELSAV